MYDLNLSVPDFTAKKYSNDNRFLLLKNYLYELNETLSFALDSKRNDEIISLAEKVGNVEKTQNSRPGATANHNPAGISGPAVV